MKTKTINTESTGKLNSYVQEKDLGFVPLVHIIHMDMALDLYIYVKIIDAYSNIVLDVIEIISK